MKDSKNRSFVHFKKNNKNQYHTSRGLNLDFKICLKLLKSERIKWQLTSKSFNLNITHF